MLTSRFRSNDDRERSAKPYCQCWNESRPTPWEHTGGCACGEHSNISEWRWEMPDNAGTSWVMMCPNQKQVTFHPFYSSGTAAVKGDTPLVHDYHYYWEVKMLTEPYGTDIMVGLGTNKVNMADSLFTFTSFLGRDGESYGLSYTGALRHNASVCRDNTGFCKGSIIGVKVDLWQGTLEFYLNRKSQGISFYNLRRHQSLYPMICSTAAQSSMRLIYAASWQASLLVDAAKILAASVNGDQSLGLPPGLRCTLKNQFWLTLPNQILHPETMPVMTRKATAQDMELKLRTALQELKASNEQCQEMLQEREDNEVEVRKMVLKNTCLKRELVDLSQQFQDVVDERDQLRVITEGFNNCSDLYEEALRKVRDLEDELINANSSIIKFQNEKQRAQVKETNHLFNELISSNNCKPHSLVTIDLTEDSILKQNSSYKSSHNKLKRYAKINKFIKKCYRYKEQYKHFSKNIPLRKERVELISKLHNYQIKLEDSIKIYEIDTQHLQSEIQVLEASLSSLNCKYIQSQNQIKEHILAANELVMCQCTCQTASNLDAVQPEVTVVPSQVQILSQDCVIEQNLIDSEQDLTQIDQLEIGGYFSANSGYHSVMFSDSIGRGLGKLVSNNLSYSTQNYCMPGSSYKHIMASLINNKYNSDTNITVFIGNSLNVRKADITDNLTEMLKLNCNKIILCAFPYFDKMSIRQNNYIHRLNKHMHFLVSHYSDKFMFFDTNIFVEHLKSTRDTVYLPISFRHTIARLLAYYINSDISSMSKSCVIKSTMFSNYTKNQVEGLNNCSTIATNSFTNCTKEVPCITMEVSLFNVGATSTCNSLPSDDTEFLGQSPDNLLN